MGYQEAQKKEEGVEQAARDGDHMCRCWHRDIHRRYVLYENLKQKRTTGCSYRCVRYFMSAPLKRVPSIHSSRP